MTLYRLVIFSAVVIVLSIMAPGILAELIDESLASRASSSSQQWLADAPQKRLMARQFALDAGPDGHFISTAQINGHRVEIMVDTGASVVALNAQTARRLGIRPQGNAFNLSLMTANGLIKTAPVTLSEIRLGDVAVRDVAATIVPDNALSINLLGMSFLSRLSGYEVNRGELVLTQ